MALDQDLGKLMEEAKKMQKSMEEAQQQLSELIVEGQSGGGLVKIQMNGRHDVKKVTIDPSLLTQKKEVLEDLAAAAFNDAVQKIEKAAQGAIAKLTGSFGIPPEFLEEGTEE